MISNYYALQILDYLFGGAEVPPATITQPLNVYVALTNASVDRADDGTTLPEVNYVGYERVMYPNTSDIWEDATLESGIPVKTNKVEFVFPEVGSPQFAFMVVGAAIVDSQTGGEIMASGYLVNVNGQPIPREFNEGEIPRFPPGSFIIRII